MYCQCNIQYGFIPKRPNSRRISPRKTPQRLDRCPTSGCGSYKRLYRWRIFPLASVLIARALVRKASRRVANSVFMSSFEIEGRGSFRLARTFSRTHSSCSASSWARRVHSAASGHFGVEVTSIDYSITAATSSFPLILVHQPRARPPAITPSARRRGRPPERALPLI
jgi:hypothetical protein